MKTASVLLLIFLSAFFASCSSRGDLVGGGPIVTRDNGQEKLTENGSLRSFSAKLVYKAVVGAAGMEAEVKRYALLLQVSNIGQWNYHRNFIVFEDYDLEDAKGGDYYVIGNTYLIKYDGDTIDLSANIIIRREE